jgi:hypothetical protein
MRKTITTLIVLSLIITSGWKNKSPEVLPRLKASFQKQVGDF